MEAKMPFDEIVDIDRLPESALVGTKDICLLARRSRTSIWRDVKAGRLPKPIRLGAYAARWRVADVRQFLAGNQN
jgi:predicted DNA-binding transcriptional regulator AlpA